MNGTATSPTGEMNCAYHSMTPSTWNRVIPWFMTALSLAVMFTLAWFLIENIYWFRRISISPNMPLDPSYRIYVYQLHLAMIKRSVGLFAGFALIFIGTSVAFYTLEREIKIGGMAGGGSAKMSTASPGIVAMLLGVALIMYTIQSKDEFPSPSSTQPLVHKPSLPPS